MPVYETRNSQSNTPAASNGLSRSAAIGQAKTGDEGNSAMLERVRQADETGAVDGPMGRVYTRIAGRADAPGFSRAQLRTYLDTTLKLAEGEFFRGAKLDGVADKLMEQLDVDRDGMVSWREFQAFEAQTLGTVAPGARDRASAEAAAGKRFGELDQNRDGSLGYDELQAGTRAALPEGTNHADLIAQLAARIALDAVDTDQRGTDLKKRGLSRGEWTTAAREMVR